jgi:hypothetical protein
MERWDSFWKAVLGDQEFRPAYPFVDSLIAILGSRSRIRSS